mgnify:CR=1 FL=1
MSKNRNLWNLLYLILAIVVAAGIWFYVDEHSDRTVSVTVTDIPIEYTNQASLADNGLMLLEGEDSGTDTTMDITFKGKRRHVVQLDRSKIRVTADLSGVTAAGVQTVNVTTSYTDREFNQSNTTIDRQSIYVASVNICELSHKEVELRCELIGNVAEGYSAGKVQLSQTSIAVRGQEEEIAKVSYAKVIFDIGKNTKETVTADLDYQFYDEDGQVLNLSGIHAEAGQIQATLPVYVTKELKLTVDFKEAPGAQLEDMIWAIKPESVVVSGDASVLNDMDSIVLDSFDLLSVTTESTSHSYAILVPDGCENLSGVTRATLEIGYPDKTVADVTTHNIRVENASASRNVELLTQELSVRIFGTAVEMEGITGEDVAVVADLSDYAVASGTYMIPAQVRVGDGKTIGVSGTYQIQVRIPES